MPNNAVTKTDFNFAMLVSYSKVSQVGSGAHATCFCHGPHDCFCSVCCTGDESTVALHMNCFYTYPSTLNMRLDRVQAQIFKSLVWLKQELNQVY